jgi:hypothetical protein
MTDTPAQDVPEAQDATAAPPAETPQAVPALEAALRASWDAMRYHSRAGAEHLLALGAHLTEAAATSSGEEWSNLLDTLHIPTAGVRNMIEMHRVALTPEALEQLGGVLLAVSWAADARLPREGEALALTLGEWRPDRRPTVVYVWPAQQPAGAFCVGLIDLAGPSAADRVTRGPLTSERDVWSTVWHLLGGRYGEVVFRPILQDVGPLVAQLEARRQALLTTDTRIVH